MVELGALVVDLVLLLLDRRASLLELGGVAQHLGALAVEVGLVGLGFSTLALVVGLPPLDLGALAL